ncbi:hypothetical protein [Amycolatopsis sp. WQ 127309]|uniref:hypothetical protein n=1 Tax=Amycolatopsis sp. WQ 127309 TaxID=2932773 RepID=UPI001FF6CE82|nr:hypothetical protein [Amycolatopsis sp. WQ 127309]UOZ05291.1 hypothetical protein MUY22_41730 [Amycolatopsis sp. WQ 127309]
MLVLRLFGTLLWFGLPAGFMTYAVHDLDVRDAPTYSIEGTVVGHRDEYHQSSQDSTGYTTYFITVRSATGDFEFGDEQQALDTEPGTLVVVQVSRTTDDIVSVRKNGTVVDLRNTVGNDIGIIVFASIGLLVALVREFLLEDYDIPRWVGFLIGLAAAGGGVYVAFLLM